MSDARLRRDIVWNLVPIALLGVVGLGMNLVIAKWWSDADLGVFNQVTITYFVFAVIGACGIQYSVLRAVAEAPEDRPRVAAVVVGALLPVVATSIVVAVAFVALRGPIGAVLDSEPVAAGIVWAAPGLCCFAINKVLLNVVNGLRRMRAFAVYTSLRYVLLGAGLAIARGLHLRGEQLPVLWTVTECVLLVVLVGELLATVSLAQSAGWMRWAKEHVAFGVRGVTSTLAHEIATKIDVWLVGMALPDAQVGIYSLAAALNEGMTQLGVVVQNNLNPLLAHELAPATVDDAARGRVKELVRRTRTWFVPLQLVGCALAAVMYPLVIPRLLGASFAAGTWPFVILMAGIALTAPWIPFVGTLLMANRPGWHSVLLGATVIVAAVGVYALIPGLGLSGAALGMSLSVIVTAVVLRSLVRSRLAISL